MQPLTDDDAPVLATVAGTRDIADTTISVPHPLSVARAREWVTRERDAMHAGVSVGLVIRRHASTSILGIMSLRHLEPEHSCAELSFWLVSSARGHGYASEAAAAIIQHGFRTLELNRIAAYQMVRNQASENVLRRLRFQEEGVLRQRVLKWGVFEDVRLWSRLRSD